MYEIQVQILAAMAAREHVTGRPMAATTINSAGRRLQVLYTCALSRSSNLAIGTRPHIPHR